MKLKETVNKILNKGLTLKNEAKLMACGLALQVATNPVVAYADDTVATTDAGKNGKNIVMDSIDILMNFIPWVGAFFIVFGGIKLLMAYRNDQDPNAISAAAKDLVIGAAFIVFSTAVWGVLKKYI